jgi:exodeoxyribonuclease-3
VGGVHCRRSTQRQRSGNSTGQPDARDASYRLSATVSHPGRLAAADLATEPPVTVMSVYVPSSDRAPDKIARKRTFVETWLAALAGMDPAARARLVVGGDWNVIARTHQPRYPGFLPFEYDLLDQLEDLGLHDAYRNIAPGVQAHSWYGRGGNGYRFDYLHVGTALRSRLQACEYVQQPRESGLSDHAAVTLSMTDVICPPMADLEPSVDGTLF